MYTMILWRNTDAADLIFDNLKGVYAETVILTHFWPMFSFSILLKDQKTLASVEKGVNLLG